MSSFRCSPVALGVALLPLWLGARCIVQSPPGAPASAARVPADRPSSPMTVLDWDGHRAAVSFTFDDAQPSHIEHYAELQAAGVPMTFYLNSGRPDGPGFDATWARAARDGHELGNHTTHHCHADPSGQTPSPAGEATKIGACIMGAPLGDAGAEIEDNAAYIRRHYPQSDVWTMASPFGDKGWIGPARPRVFINRGVGAGMIAPYAHVDPFDLPVHMASAGETASSFNRLTDRARAGGDWLIFLFHTISPTAANWYNPVDVAEVVRCMTYPRSLGDVWVDTVANVGAYWRGQQLLAALPPSSSGVNTTWNWVLPPHFPPGKQLRVTVAAGTLSQNGRPLPRGPRGDYRVALDAGNLTLSR